ncbi:MAG: hypothetical protein R3350_07910 [Saprospiraceae bacterium]|nr:hypothetical protein [Saprospiraceae bacterium]
MDFQRAKILLNKVNALFKSSQEEAFSSIERDLILTYLRELYEIVREGQTATESPRENTIDPKTSNNSNRLEKRSYTPPKIIEIPENLRDLEKKEEVAPKKQHSSGSDRTESQPDRSAQKTQSSSGPARKTSRPSGDATEKAGHKLFDALLERREATELSEKLSESPVRDLTRGLAINDRLLYINELFGRDAEAMEESLRLLNKFESLEEAKSLLVNLAEQHEWTSEEKLDTARSFVKWVRRKDR